MPTGYTEKIENGEITSGKEFIKLCLNSFGIMVHRREEGMTTDYQDFSEVYKSDIERHMMYLESHIQNKESLMGKWANNKDAYKSQAKNEIEECLKNLNESYQKRQELYKKYAKIRNEILSWDCNDDYKNIKEFAISQIDMCLPNLEYYPKEIELYTGYLLDFEKYIEEKYQSELEYYDKCIQMDKDDINNIKESIKTKQAFYDNLMLELENIKSE